MKITTERLPHCQIAMTIEPDAEQVQEALRKAAKKISQRYNIPGFRKGKAPYAAVVRAYGKEALYEQVVEDIGDKLYQQALEETGLQPIAPGALEDVTFDPLVFKLTLPMPPEVDLGDYRSVRVERPAVEVTDAEVEAELKRMQQEQSEWAPVEEGAAAMGDLLSLRLNVRIDDQTILDEEGFELVLEPENQDFPPGFDSQFVGQSVGANLTFDLTYPSDWPSNRAGKTAHFAAEILSIKRHQVPALDDDFAALVGDYDTLDALKSSVRAALVARRQADADRDYADQVITKMMEQATIDYPPVLAEEQLNQLVDERKRSLERSGIPFADFLRIMRQTEAQFRNQFKEAAEWRLRADLLLDRVPAAEGLTVSEEEVDAAVQELLSDADDAAASMRDLLQSPAVRSRIAADLIRRKALMRLVEIAEGKAPDLPVAAVAEAAAAAPSAEALAAPEAASAPAVAATAELAPAAAETEAA